MTVVGAHTMLANDTNVTRYTLLTLWFLPALDCLIFNHCVTLLTTSLNHLDIHKLNDAYSKVELIHCFYWIILLIGLCIARCKKCERSRLRSLGTRYSMMRAIWQPQYERVYIVCNFIFIFIKTKHFTIFSRLYAITIYTTRADSIRFCAINFWNAKIHVHWNIIRLW